MLSLIVKDLLVQRKQIALSFFYILLIILTFQNGEVGTFTAAISAFTYMLVTYSCASEEKNRTDVMINSLPVRRVHIVAMKYLSVIIFFLVGSVAYMLFTSIIKNTGIGIRIYMLTIEGFFGGFFSVSLMAGIYFPIYFKVGYMKSRIINLILFFGAFVGITYIVKYIQAIDSDFFNKVLMNISVFQNNTVIALVLSALIAIFLTVSYGISVKIYVSRDL